MLYTYQTIAREILKEQIFEKRVHFLKLGDMTGYQEVLDARNKEFQGVQVEIKELIFDYFNLITKEYEMGFEKWKADKDYQEQVTQIKTHVDEEYVDKKWEDIPEGLTAEKTREIINEK